MNYGNRIKSERCLAGMTQTDFAKVIGRDTNTVSMWENEKREPLLTDISAMAALFSCSADWLIGLSEVREQR